MLYLLTNAIKKKFVNIYQDILLQHPIFSKAKVDTRFPQEERPKIAVLVRSTSGGSQKISLDNFIGVQRGFCSLANLKGIKGNSIEWVKDDEKNLDKLSPAGFYIVKITEHQKNSNEFQFVVEPFLNVIDEDLEIGFLKGKEGVTLKNFPINPNTEIIFSEANSFEFKRGIDYKIDYETGEVLFEDSVKKYMPIVADYQFLSNVSGPFTIEYNTINDTAIPGVILAFGDRLDVGDEQVVVIEREFRDVAKIYGGRWILDMETIVVAQDPDQQERLLDFLITSLWAEYQDKLANQGIAISEFVLGGEVENLEAEIAEEYSYQASISFTCEFEWEVSTPLISELRRINIGYGEENFKNNLDHITENQYEVGQFDERQINSNHQNGLQIIPSLESYKVFPNNYKRNSRNY